MTLREHVGPVNDVAVNQNETQLASVSGDGRLIIWNLVSGEVVKIIAGGERGVACVCWSVRSELDHELDYADHCRAITFL
jgi:WD40 repeat protein